MQLLLYGVTGGTTTFIRREKILTGFSIPWSLIQRSLGCILSFSFRPIAKTHGHPQRENLMELLRTLDNTWSFIRRSLSCSSEELRTLLTFSLYGWKWDDHFHAQRENSRFLGASSRGVWVASWVKPHGSPTIAFHSGQYPSLGFQCFRALCRSKMVEN